MGASSAAILTDRLAGTEEEPVARRRTSRRRLVLLSLAVIAASMAACHPSVFVSVSHGSLEPKAEAQYQDVWSKSSRAMATARERFRSGVCNVGGDQRGCYDTSATAVAAIDGFLAALDRTAVPSRYRDADAAVRGALRTMRAGLGRRNQGLATGNDSDFVAGNDMVKAADSALHRAYGKFPVDAPPHPGF